MKTVVVNADDFGLVSGVNRAIIDAFQAGSVTSATLMVNMPAASEAATLAAANPGLGVGLHFNLTLGRPVSDASLVSTLVDKNGNFYPRTWLARKILLGSVKLSEVQVELDAQFQKSISLGILPTHIDSHQHVHVFTGIFDSVAQLCHQHGIPMRVPWPNRLSGVRVGLVRWFKMAMMSLILSKNTRKWQGLVQWNTGLGSLFDLGAIDSSPRFEDYARILQHAGEGVFELMVHPVRYASDVRGLTKIGMLSEAEYSLLRMPGFDEYLLQAGYQLVNYAHAFSANKTAPGG